MFDERYKPNALRKRNSLHAKFPASHFVVTRHATSSGIITNVTIKSAAARCDISRLILDLRCLARKRVMNTDKLPTAATLNRTQYTATTARTFALDSSKLRA
jgi:hypothetical protein